MDITSLGRAPAPARPGTVARHAGGQGGGRAARAVGSARERSGTTAGLAGAARDLPGDKLLPSLSHSPPRRLQGESEDYCRLDGRYRFVGRGGVVAVGHHLFAEGVDRQEAERAWQSWLDRLLA